MRGTTIELLWSHGIVCPLVRRSSRCTWGFYVAWKAGLHHKALFPHSTPERQSLCESPRQRRVVAHWGYHTRLWEWLPRLGFNGNLVAGPTCEGRVPQRESP